MHAITLIFPNQLFEHHPSLSTDRPVWIVEDFLFFRQYTFHVQKLILHRATMKAYQTYLVRQGYVVRYVDSTHLTSRKSLKNILNQEKVTDIHIVDVVDTWVEKDLQIADIKIHTSESPMFMTSRAEYEAFFAAQKKPFMKTFYEWQRRRLGILMEKNGTPLGGQYSFDTENRKKLPKEYKEPKRKIQSEYATLDTDLQYIKDARLYVTKHFPDTYGDKDNFDYAIDHDGAKQALQEFIEHRLYDFGVYEDAISSEYRTLNHSVLTPYLNIGLITPHEVVEAVLVAYEKGKAPINSVEGFVRQIIGWREFMRAMYMLHGTKMRTKNFWQHTKKLSKDWWQGTTGITPIDTVITRTLESAYSHHIERLMIVGNYMLLDEIDPSEAYRWFMEMYIDAYDWVMVPNVYGMSQFADGGIFATKPYISGSNYIIKMSDYKKGTWSVTWDQKFWNFLDKHRLFLGRNPRMAMLISMRDKKRNNT